VSLTYALNTIVDFSVFVFWNLVDILYLWKLYEFGIKIDLNLSKQTLDNRISQPLSPLMENTSIHTTKLKDDLHRLFRVICVCTSMFDFKPYE
jgi:hypothetical protein